MAMKLDHEDLNRLIEKISTSDIQEFSLEGEDFKLEIKRNLIDQNQVNKNLDSNSSFDRQVIANQKSINENIPLANKPEICLLYTSPSPRDATLSRMPSSA